MQALGTTFDHLTKVRVSSTNYSYYIQNAKFYLIGTVAEVKKGQDFLNSNLLETGKIASFVIDSNQYDLENPDVADYFKNKLEKDLKENQLVCYVDEHVEPRSENLPRYAGNQQRNKIRGTFNTRNVGCLRI